MFYFTKGRDLIQWYTPVIMIVCSYHITYAFQSESTFYSWLNVKELLAQNMCKIWSLSDCNGTRTHNLLVRKRILNHLAKLGKWLICVMSTHLYSACDCMFLLCHVRVQIESTLYSCLNVKELLVRNKLRNLKFKWLQRDSTPQPLSTWTNTLSQTG